MTQYTLFLFFKPTKESNWSLRQTNSRPFMLSVEKTEISLGLKMTFSVAQEHRGN